MSYCRLEDAGVYRATLEAMLFGAVTQEAEGQKFNDSVLGKKERKVGDLVAKFDKNLVMEDTGMEAEPEPELQETTPTPKELSMESFVAGILRTSSPIPQETPEDKTEQELQETPILPFRPAKIGSSEPEITPEVVPTKPRPLQPQAEATKAYRTSLKTQGRAKIAEAKGSTTPKTEGTAPALQGSPDSAYGSPGSSEASSAASTPMDPSTHPQDRDSTSEQSELAQIRMEEPDIYLKLARAQLHKTIKEYSKWEAETISIMAETAASRRQEALQKIPEPCSITRTMLQVYQKCISGETAKEMDTIIVSIFHLLEEQVHLPRISVLEEYVVMKFNKKSM